MRRRGFTLLELMVVIALLALLSALLVMGIGKMQTNGKRQQTRLIMQNLSAMFADYDVTRRVPFGAGNLSPALILFNNLPANYLAMPAPGDVANGTDRTGSAVCFTRDFMFQLMSTPGNTASIGKLPSSSLMTFVGSSISGAVAWDDTAKYRIYGTALYGGTTYVRTQLYVDPAGTGVVLKDGQANSGSSAAPTYTINSPPNYYYWMPDLVVTAGTPLPTPVVLDAWENPIIFVMGGVLGNGAALAANGTVTPGSGALLAGGNSVQINSPDYHPFFASAGPDGDFSKGDDNLYSFEK